MVTKTKGIVAQAAAAKKKHSHIVCEAFAGTGKTFTSVLGITYAYGSKKTQKQLVKALGFEPVLSDEQQAIVDAMAQEKAQTVTYCAFNRSIVQEFEQDWQFVKEYLKADGVDLQFATVNGLGHRIVTKEYGRIGKPTDYHCQNLLAKLNGMDPWEQKKQLGSEYLKAFATLCDLAKLNLLGWTRENGFDAETISDDDLYQVASHHDITLNGKSQLIFDDVRRVLAECPKVDEHKEIDWNDQNWLPIVNRLPIPTVDMLIVDEGQDLPRCKQEFAYKMGKRIMIVGDRCQAIYGFAGADHNSIPHMKELLGVSESLRLTETRRCGKAIVDHANDTLRIIFDRMGETFVPMKAHDSNPDGSLEYTTTELWDQMADDGDMFLSRVNAPLVSNALRLIVQDRKAVIRGRKFGTELKNFIDKTLKPEDITDLQDKLDDWYQTEIEKEHKKKFPSDDRLIALADKRDCVEAFMDGAITLDDVTKRIDRVFAGKQCPTCRRAYDEELLRCPNRKCQTETLPGSKYPVGPVLITPEGIQLSSIHRAKGLEAKRVFILKTEQASIPHPMAKTQAAIDQEWNLLYVAQTRAINQLVYVTKAKT